MTVTTVNATDDPDPDRRRMAFDRDEQLWHEQRGRWSTGVFPHQRFCASLQDLDEKFGPLQIVPYKPWPEPPRDPDQARPARRTP
ncbi:hypothetical protein [Nocardia sp. IFM 10818]